MKPPSSFLQTMEEYVRDAPRMSIARKDQVQKFCVIDLCWREEQNSKGASDIIYVEN